MAVLSLHYCTQTFSSCGEQGLLSSCSWRASHCGGFSCFRARALEHIQVSVVTAQGLISCNSRALEHMGFSSCGVWACSEACRIFPDQGLNPSILYFKADS